MILNSDKLSLDKKCQDLREKMIEIERSGQEYKYRANEAEKKVHELTKKITEMETKHRFLLRQSRKMKTERKNQEGIVKMETRCQFHQHFMSSFCDNQFMLNLL